jgi:hypothetical protein
MLYWPLGVTVWIALVAYAVVSVPALARRITTVMTMSSPSALKR